MIDNKATPELQAIPQPKEKTLQEIMKEYDILNIKLDVILQKLKNKANK